jgi:hypothetical protein
VQAHELLLPVGLELTAKGPTGPVGTQHQLFFFFFFFLFFFLFFFGGFFLLFSRGCGALFRLVWPGFSALERH